MPFLTGLFDVDLEISPATNALPIRRLVLQVGEAWKVESVWVRFPSLKLERLRKRYSRISNKSYKYEVLSNGYNGGTGI